jgi:hypothetical protein
MNSGRISGLRREICETWRRKPRGKRKGKEEEGEGIYRVDSLLDSMPGNGRNQEVLTAAVSGAGRTKVEDDLLGGSHLSTVNEKEKKREEGGRGLRVGSTAAGLVLPGSAQ